MAQSLVTVADANLQTLGLRVGGYFQTATDADPVKIAAILSTTEFLLEAAAGANSGSAGVLTSGDTVASQKLWLRNLANSYDNRRVALVWSEANVHARFIGAEVAGLRSALPSHLGLTRTQVATASSAPAMHYRYSDDDLDEIAAAGVFIVTQDVDGGPLYIRHQLTTKTDAGSLYYEDSVGTNMDFRSFELDDLIEPHLGVRNVTPQLISRLRIDWEDSLNRNLANRYGDDAGPELIAWRDMVVEAHPTLRDRIKFYVVLEFPVPFNNAEAVLSGETALNL